MIRPFRCPLSVPILIIGLFFMTSCAPRELVPTAGEVTRTAAVPTPEEAAPTREIILADISMEGGSGKAAIRSPVEVTVRDGGMTARFVWTSCFYDYMIVDGIRYDNENENGDSTFTVPIRSMEEPLTVIGDTTAMSTPHEITYVIRWEKEPEEAAPDVSDPGQEDAGPARTDAAAEALRNAGLVSTGSVALTYARRFEIEHYGDCDLIFIENSGEYLAVPVGASVPEKLPESLTVIPRPPAGVYLVSTSAMDLIDRCGALNRVRFSGTSVNDWYIEGARAAMKRGDILYAGKYRAPDYELLLGSGCDLAIENTMIYHEPAVREKLEELGIPVLVETSSYEEHPLGRLEWIKLYGCLFGREAEAEEIFDRELAIMKPILEQKEESGKTVSFFHVTAGGQVCVRRSGDYITRMIGLAGGSYVPEDAGEDSPALSSMNMQMEDYYAQASQADILIYNSTIGGEIRSISELIDKNPLFGDFKAVKEGRVYCTERQLFQQISGMTEFMRDLYDVFHDVNRDYTYLYRLE